MLKTAIEALEVTMLGVDVQTLSIQISNISKNWRKKVRIQKVPWDKTLKRLSPQCQVIPTKGG